MIIKRVMERTGSGRLYVLRIELECGLIVHKIGICYTPRSVDRMMEILRSWFMVYRYVPKTLLKLDQSTGVPRLLEKYLHELYKDYKWVPTKKVDGYQEMFIGLDEKLVTNYIKNFNYGLLLEGVTSMSTEDYSYIASKQRSSSFDIDEDIAF